MKLYCPQPGTAPARAFEILKALGPGEVLPNAELATALGQPNAAVIGALAQGRQKGFFIAAQGPDRRNAISWRLGTLEEQRHACSAWSSAIESDPDAQRVVINGGKGRDEPKVRHHVEEVWVSTSGEMLVQTRTEEFHFAPADAKALIKAIKAMPIEVD